MSTRGSTAGVTVKRLIEASVEKVLALSSSISILTTLILIAILLFESAEFFRKVNVFEFLSSIKWAPLFSPPSYGVLPLVAGTFLTSLIALLVAAPIGLFTAIYLSQYAPKKVRSIIKPLLEVLVGVPTVVYGYYALVFVTPFLKKFIPDLEVFNALSAGLVMGIMIIPVVASISEDVMSSIPRHVKEGAYALGATKLDTTLKVIIPAASSGIIASLLLAFSRAIGETMIVAMAAGSTPNFTLNPFKGVQTMTAYIAQVSLGDTPFGSIEYYSIYAVALLLFLITLVFNIIGRRIAGWKKEIH